MPSIRFLDSVLSARIHVRKVTKQLCDPQCILSSPALRFRNFIHSANDFFKQHGRGPNPQLLGTELGVSAGLAPSTGSVQPATSGRSEGYSTNNTSSAAGRRFECETNDIQI